MNSCWQCNSSIERPHPICSNCGCVLPPNPNQTYFQLFELQTRFDLSTSKLRESYRALQRVIHPDRVAGASERERRFAMEQSTLVNDAFRTLKSPMRRAAYLLASMGIATGEESRVQPTPSFLMNILEIREALDELDGPDAHVERSKLKQTVQLQYEETLNRLGTRLDSQLAESEDTATLLGQLFAELQYLEKTLVEIERFEY